MQIVHFETTETCDKFVSSSRRNKHIYVIAADQNLGKQKYCEVYISQENVCSCLY